jgi:hypothetical protein
MSSPRLVARSQPGLRVTPAMEAGIATTPWTVADIVRLICKESELAAYFWRILSPMAEQLIVAVLLIFSLPPVPRNAPQNQSEKANSGNGSATENKSPTALVPVTNTITPNNPQNLAKGKTDKAEQKNVSITVLPRLDVNKDRWDYISIGASAILALITFGIAWTALVQAKAAKVSAETAISSARFAERATVLTERADVLLEMIGIQLPQNNVYDGNSWVVLQFKNFGRTRAKGVRFECHLICYDMPTGKDAAPLPEIVLGPGVSQTVGFEPFNKWLTLGTFNAIMEGKETLKFTATAVYEDVFGDRHTTECKGLLAEPMKRLFKIDVHRAD